MERPGHDLHGLLHPEHLGTVFQQCLPRRHDEIHDAAAQLLVRKDLSAGHCCTSLVMNVVLFYHVRQPHTRGYNKKLWKYQSFLAETIKVRK